MKKHFLSFTFALLAGCNSSIVETASDAIDGVPEKTINTDILGANAFANDGRFGTQSAQFKEVRDTLGLNFVRVLLQWNDGVQPSKNSPLNLAFADSVIGNLPNGVDALVILTAAPSWMRDRSQWDGGDAGLTFANKFVAPVLAKYGGNGRIIGFQIWNEPNQENTDNETMGFVNNPSAYVSALQKSYTVIRRLAPSKLVVGAATTAINQNFPNTLKYNRAMRDAGAQSFCDIWAIHYYGRQFENVTRPGGVADFVNGLSKPTWVTETGAQGVNNQLKYGRQVWPYLTDKMKGIQRIYLYQFTESTPPETTYGLRNLSRDFPVSDLYVHLRERAR
jgi:hypothetical protein